MVSVRPVSALASRGDDVAVAVDIEGRNEHGGRADHEHGKRGRADEHGLQAHCRSRSIRSTRTGSVPKSTAISAAPAAVNSAAS